VFLARYTDLFGPRQYKYNIMFKIFYILSSFYTIGVMQWVFPRTREKELSWKMGAACFFGALVLSPFTMMIFQAKDEWSMFYVSLDLPSRHRTPYQRQHTILTMSANSGFGICPTSSSPSASSPSSSSFDRRPFPPL
jgi:hypothetical protein